MSIHLCVTSLDEYSRPFTNLTRLKDVPPLRIPRYQTSKPYIPFLTPLNKGVNMNNLTFRKPTKIYHLDASEFGLGGFNLTFGMAWQLPLINLTKLIGVHSLCSECMGRHIS